MRAHRNDYTKLCQTAGVLQPKVNVEGKVIVLMFLEGGGINKICLCYMLCLTVFVTELSVGGADKGNKTSV